MVTIATHLVIMITRNTLKLNSRVTMPTNQVPAMRAQEKEKQMEGWVLGGSTIYSLPAD